MGGYITIAGVGFPYPDYSSGLQTTKTQVSSSTNANGVTIGQQIGRTQSKIELQWSVMSASLWSTLLQLFKTNYVNDVTYYDMEEGKVVTRSLTVSDRSALPAVVDTDTGMWITAQDCKLTLTDTGA